MDAFTDIWLRVAVALGIGLLIGVERERRKDEGPAPAPGVRTFALTAVLGAVCFRLGDTLLLAVVAGGMAVLTALSSWAGKDQGSGMTTDVSLLLTLVLGALAIIDPTLASGLGVIAALLLAARGRLHHFVRRVITDAELHDALVLAGAALVVMPLMPNRYIGPFGAINPRSLWTVVVLMLAISLGGHLALRLLGPRYGTVVTGLISGFVSSTVTVSVMGSRARKDPALMPGAAGGAVLSTVATMVVMAVVLGATSRATLAAMAIPLVAAGGVAALYAAWFVLRSLRQPAPPAAPDDTTFSFGSALALAATIGVALMGAAALNAWLGRTGLLAAAAAAGLGDAHAPAISVASLVAGGKMPFGAAVLPILIGMSANTLTKVVLAFVSGGPRFALQVVPGLLLAIGAAWAGAFAF
jgi:uncharacterized membrane protein (DUF4010 family)